MISKSRDRFLACVDRGLSHLGETIKHVVYWYLENEYDLKKDAIPDKPEEFMKALEKMYGPGAKVMERNMVREMNSEFRMKANTFIEAVRNIKFDETSGEAPKC